MNKALIFNNDGSKHLISAMDIKAGLFSRNDYEFVDPEYEFKVEYVSGAKNHGKPYFRLYYSYEDYKKLYPDRADRYEIVANMRRYQESQWHRQWKNVLSSFCEIEKCIEDAVHNRLELMIPQIAARNGIDEALKAEKPLEWVAQMNLCKAQAEEAVLAELIYSDLAVEGSV